MAEKQYSGRTIAAAARKKSNTSRTSGRDKGPACQACPLDKYIAKRNRSYKLREYSAWCARKRGHK